MVLYVGVLCIKIISSEEIVGVFNIFKINPLLNNNIFECNIQTILNLNLNYICLLT